MNQIEKIETNISSNVYSLITKQLKEINIQSLSTFKNLTLSESLDQYWISWKAIFCVPLILVVPILTFFLKNRFSPLTTVNTEQEVNQQPINDDSDDTEQEVNQQPINRNLNNNQNTNWINNVRFKHIIFLTIILVPIAAYTVIDYLYNNYFKPKPSSWW